MSDRPKWLRADLLVFVAVVVVFAIAAISPNWRQGMAGSIGHAGTSVPDLERSRVPSLDRLPAPQGPREIDPSKLERHRSPFDDAVTARAETLCVHMVESQLGYAFKEPVTASVQDRYGTGNEDDGRGVYLIFEGLATAPSKRASAWRCTSKSYGAYPGGPYITHVDSP